MTEQGALSVFLELPAYVEVEGSPSQLRRLALRIRQAGGEAITIDVASIGPDSVHTILVRQSDTLVHIRHSSGVLSIEGAQDRLGVLAGNIEYAASDPGGAHVHMEHHEGHPYLASGSIPLVVSRRGDE